MNNKTPSNMFHTALLAFLTICIIGLYLTAPSDAIKQCEKVNTPKMCEILNAG